MKKTLSVLTLAALVLTLLAPAALATGGAGQTTTAWDQLLLETLKSVESLSDPSATLTVSGASYVTAVPDMATVQVGVSITQAEVKDAQDQANQTMEAILAALKDLGIADTAIATSNYSVSPAYDYSGESRQLTGYQVSNQLSVTVTDFDLVNQVIDVSVQNGATDIYGLSFDLSGRAEYYQQALTAAVADGQAKAATLAQAAGKTLGDLVSVTEQGGGVSVLAKSEAAMDMAAGATNIQAGQTQVSANVTLVYEIK